MFTGNLAHNHNSAALQSWSTEVTEHLSETAFAICFETWNPFGNSNQVDIWIRSVSIYHCLCLAGYREQGLPEDVWEESLSSSLADLTWWFRKSPKKERKEIQIKSSRKKKKKPCVKPGSDVRHSRWQKECSGCGGDGPVREERICRVQTTSGCFLLTGWQQDTSRTCRTEADSNWVLKENMDTWRYLLVVLLDSVFKFCYSVLLSYSCI